MKYIPIALTAIAPLFADPGITIEFKLIVPYNPPPEITHACIETEEPDWIKSIVCR